MRSTLLGVLICGLLIALIVAAALAVVAWGTRPWSVPWCGSYHVLVDLLAGLIAYGVASALVLRALLAVRPLPEGSFPMASPVFAYGKALTVLSMLGQWALLPVSTAFTRPFIVRLFGPRLRSDVAIGGTIDDPVLVTLGGAGAVIDHDDVAAGTVIAGGAIIVGRVRVGAEIPAGGV